MADTMTLDARKCFDVLLGGAAALSRHEQELNDLNVFPVSDGDTGTNMKSTIEGGLAAADGDTQDLGAFFRGFSRGVLLSARGNSGVILSQIIAGIGETLAKCDKVDALALAEAYTNGIARSYAAVQNPTEGTILTVFRESAEYAAKRITRDSSVEEFYTYLIEQARQSLAETPQKLPVLAEADVVDSGAAGYVYITQGMLEALSGAVVSRDLPVRAQSAAPNVDIDLFTRDSRLEYGYCTEFLLRLTTDRVDPDSFELQCVLDDLKALGGESVVAYKTDDIVKVHVHTFEPGAVLSKMQAYGEFLTVKIENMMLGHTEYTARKPQKPFSVVAVATGEGMGNLFREMGADEVIQGGQSANPSAQDFIDAFKKCGSGAILVLPNNKNIVMAARQAAELYDSARVLVVKTENLMQGYGALNVITPGITDPDVLAESAESAARGVKCIEVTRAVRDATIEGVSAKQGQYIAICDGKMTCAEDSPESAAMEALRREDMDLSEIITLFYGKDSDENAREAFVSGVEEAFPDCEVKCLSGGQDVYDWLIAIE